MSRHVLLPRVVTVLAFVTLVGLPLAARAAEVAPPSGAAKPVNGGPAAQSGNARTATPAAAVPAAKTYVPRTPEERALADLDTETHQAVDALVVAMNGLQDGPDLRALQMKLVQTKVDFEVKSLRIKAQYARARGDIVSAGTAEDRIDAILHPKPAAPVASQRPVPSPDKSDAR